MHVVYSQILIPKECCPALMKSSLGCVLLRFFWTVRKPINYFYLIFSKHPFCARLPTTFSIRMPNTQYVTTYCPRGQPWHTRAYWHLQPLITVSPPYLLRPCFQSTGIHFVVFFCLLNCYVFKNIFFVRARSLPPTTAVYLVGNIYL